MSKISPYVARIIAKIPVERVLSHARNGRIPEIGEIGKLDHAYTESGVEYQGVYRLDENGKELWSANLLASEYEGMLRNPDAST